MALYSQIEDRYLAALTAVQFPEAPVADTQQPVTDATSVDGMQLAAGPSQTVTDAGAGRGSYAGFDPRQDAANKAPMGEVKPYDPTVREQLAEFLQAGFERFGMDRYKARKNAQSLIGGPNSNLPLDMGLADIVPFLGTALQTQEAVRMGEDAVTSAKRGDYGVAALQAGGAALGMVPGAAGTVRAAKPLVPKAAEMMMDAAEKTGMPVRGLGMVGNDVSYRGVHTAPKRGDATASGDDLTKIFPDDIYSARAAQFYGHFGGDNAMDKNSARLIRMMRGKPDMDVMIFRAVPKNAKGTEINPGDWVTINKDYAKDHGEGVLGGDYKIISKMVKAKDIQTDGNSIHEWGYDPAAKEQK